MPNCIQQATVLLVASMGAGVGLLPGCTTTQTPPHDAFANLPPAFTDHVPYPHQRVAFEMVLIPGDTDAGLKPFYIGKTEVTWDMFRGWSEAIDLDSQEQIALEVAQGLRPSELYADRPNVRMGFGQRPAIGMTCETAEHFCAWLSKKTGRTYRLPTDTEWSHVLKRSGGAPAKGEELLTQAVLAANAPLDRLGLDGISATVASKQPDALGLYDLIGNAAEWVRPTDAGRWVRGGHFQLETKQLNANWRSVEDFDIWNTSSPQVPSDASWYVDHYYQGIRLVCEVQADEQ